MALNIRSSSGSSSATSTSTASSQKASSADLFVQGMAAAAARSAQAAAQSAQTAAALKQAKHTSAPKPATASKSAQPKPKPHASDDDDQHSTSSSSKSNAAGKSGAGKSTAGAQSSRSSSAQAAQDAQSGQDGDQATAQATADDANSDDSANVANTPKGRATARSGPGAKNGAPQNTAAAKARDAADDPSADSANQSGLSLIEMLAQSLGSNDSDAAPTDTDTDASAVTAKADDTDQTADDPNAIALAMFTQALAAALVKQQTSGGDAAAAGDATSAIGATGSRSSMQDLMSVLAHNVATDANGQSDDGASQLNADGSASNTGASDTTGAGLNAAAHLGVASHFATQHLRNDPNTAELKASVGSSAWEDEVGAHLTWMTQKGLETGSLRVSPEHLGPVEVNISVQNGDASVWFAANHPDTRAALEQALPRLREMFASQGMNLADSGVSRQSLSQQESRNRGRSAASQSVSGVSAVGGADAGSSTASRINLSLVDLYA